MLLLANCSQLEKGHYLTDENFVLLSDSISPNRKYKYLEYHFDNGAFGYSRVFWTIMELENHEKNLLKGKLPDGYMIKGWTKENELELEKWEPYYYKDIEIDFKTSSEFKGIKLIVTEKKNVG